MSLAQTEVTKVFKKARGTAATRAHALIKRVKFESALYIGASARIKEDGTRLKKTWEADKLKRYGKYVDLLEIYPSNIEGYENDSLFRKKILGDARTIDEHVEQNYDIIMWWHGPEHIYEHELSSAVEKIRDVCNHFVVFGCPWGTYEQGAVYGNPHEEHKSYLQPRHFQDLGFVTATVGQQSTRHGSIVAWLDVSW